MCRGSSLLALGARPQRLTGSWAGVIDPDAAAASRRDGRRVARLLRNCAGDAHPLDALIVCNDSQAHLRLFYVLRATAAGLPVHLLDMPRDASEPARRFARFQLEALAEFFATVTGRALDAASLGAAATPKQPSATRCDGCAAGAVRTPRCARATMRSTRCWTLHAWHPTDAVTRLDAAGGQAAPVPSGAIRVHVTGSSHPDAAVYRELESDGRCVIVSEDHDTGDAAWLGVAVRGETAEHVLEGLIDAHFARVTTSATTSGAVRAAFTRDIARAAGAHAVAAIIRELDEAPLWDLADQRVALRAAPPSSAFAWRPGARSERPENSCARSSRGRCRHERSAPGGLARLESAAVATAFQKEWFLSLARQGARRRADRVGERGCPARAAARSRHPVCRQSVVVVDHLGQAHRRCQPRRRRRAGAAR